MPKKAVSSWKYGSLYYIRAMIILRNSGRPQLYTYKDYGRVYYLSPKIIFLSYIKCIVGHIWPSEHISHP